MTTATSNGSVNAMHDSFQPLGGLVPMSLMMLNVDFSGIGAGFLNMLMYIIVAVFLAGLMVGPDARVPGQEDRGQGGQAGDDRGPDPPALDHLRNGPFRGDRLGPENHGQPGPHGFSEVLYEFTSAAANNGSGFEGLSDNNPAWNIATGVVLLLGRFPGARAADRDRRLPRREETSPRRRERCLTNDLTFAAMLLGTVLLVGALSFMPAVVLGPVADHLAGAGPSR